MVHTNQCRHDDSLPSKAGGWCWRRDLPFLIILVGVLAGGLWSLRLIPVYKPFWGLDFQNVYIFHVCEAARNLGIYGATGAECGDVSGRPLIYPPLMFHLFDWVRLFAFEQAVAMWTGAISVLIFVIGAVWAWLDGRFQRTWRFVALVAFWILLVAQFPSVFIIERGNTDIVPLLFWTGAAALFVSSRYVPSGSAMALAVLAKVYPVVALVVVGAGLLRMHWRVWAAVAIGGLVTCGVVIVLWPADMYQYFAEQMPAIARTVSPANGYTHSIRALSVDTYVHIALAIALVGSWVVASWRRFQEQRLLIFAGGLAISTYLSGISWDYNLITTYPLILLVTARALSQDSAPTWKIASIASLVTIVTGRGLFPPEGQIVLQIGTLIAIALLVATTEAESSSSVDLSEDTGASQG